MKDTRKDPREDFRPLKDYEVYVLPEDREITILAGEVIIQGSDQHETVKIREEDFLNFFDVYLDDRLNQKKS